MISIKIISAMVAKMRTTSFTLQDSLRCFSSQVGRMAGRFKTLLKDLGHWATGPLGWGWDITNLVMSK